MKRMLMVLSALLAAALIPSCSSTTNKIIESNTSVTNVAALPVFETSAQEIKVSEAKVIAGATTLVEKIAAIKPGEATFENSVAALDTALWQVKIARDRFYLLANVSPDGEVRGQAITSKVEMDAWIIDLDFRKDVDAVLRAYADTNPVLSGEDRRLLEERLRIYKRNGVRLSEETQQQIRSLKKEIAGLESTIQLNINVSARDVVTVTVGQVAGMPEKILAEFEADATGNYIIPVGIGYKAALFLQFCPDEEARKIVLGAQLSRGALANRSLMTDVVRKRAQLARLLGYASWADYQTEGRMAGSGRGALDFVQGLIDSLEPAFRAEVETLRQLKADETGHSDARLEAWDAAYYTRILQKTRYHLDSAALMQYFRYETVRDGMFRIVEKVFHLKIETMASPPVWSPRVQVVRISDAGSGEILGYLYLDVFPRTDQGKFGGAATFPLTSGAFLPDRGYQRPVAALVCNFPEPTPDRPSLLTYDQVKLLFHEFGHALHQIVSTARYAQFSGIASVPFDFIEVPSQTLENWLTDITVLEQFAVNYLDPTDRITADMLANLDAANKAVIALYYRESYLGPAKMDLLLHSAIAPDNGFDIVASTNRILAETYLPYTNKSSMITSFSHLFLSDGYDAGYYSYVWSFVIADDIAALFRNSSQGFLDANLGQKLRTEVYQVGNSRDVNESVTAFLGRPWNSGAFLGRLGIGK